MSIGNTAACIAACKKEHILIGGQTLHVCLSEYIVTDHGSILVNKFYACSNLVKIIFNCFVSCSLIFQAFYIRNSMVYRSILKNQCFKKSRQPDTYLRLIELEHAFFCALFFHVVLLLTSHSAQKFYLLIHVNNETLNMLMYPITFILFNLETTATVTPLLDNGVKKTSKRRSFILLIFIMLLSLSNFKKCTLIRTLIFHRQKLC